MTTEIEKLEKDFENNFIQEEFECKCGKAHSPEMLNTRDPKKIKLWIFSEFGPQVVKMTKKALPSYVLRDLRKVVNKVKEAP